MHEEILNVHDLTVTADGDTVLHSIDLSIKASSVHVLMGPSDSGISALEHVITGAPGYTIESGSITFEGEPLVLPGASSVEASDCGSVVFAPLNALVDSIDSCDRAKLLILTEPERELTEQERNSIANAIARFRAEHGGAVLVIAHDTALLEQLDVDEVHVLVRDRIIANGKADLFPELGEDGFDRYATALFNAGVDARMAQAEGIAGALTAEKLIEEALQEQLEESAHQAKATLSNR